MGHLVWMMMVASHWSAVSVQPSDWLRIARLRGRGGAHCRVSGVIAITMLASHWSTVPLLPSHWLRTITMLASHWSTVPLVPSHWLRTITMMRRVEGGGGGGLRLPGGGVNILQSRFQKKDRSSEQKIAEQI